MMSTKTYDAVAIGECLIDFIPSGAFSESGGPLLERNPGGAPVNVMAALARLGKKTGFIGKVGNDPFGRYLADVLAESGIDAGGLAFADDAHTTMVFVHLDANGERSFHFARKPGADELLRAEEVDRERVGSAAVFHFGSVSLSSEPARSATLFAARLAREAGALVSYDPNWRAPLWTGGEEEARRTILKGLELADVAKVSAEELVFLTGAEDAEEGTARLMARFGQLRLVLATLGAEGTYYRKPGAAGYVASYSVKTVDTTGAGDGFLGAFLYQALERMPRDVLDWSEEETREAVAFANAAGALATTRKGAIHSLASLREIEELQGLQVR